jgi:hypothetical protein
MDAALEKKLREMIDRQEIWQVLQRYGRGLDRFDRELLRSCYFDDAIEDHGHFVGNVEDFIDWANATSALFETCHHNVLNHYCELDGDDAYCETYFLFIGVATKPPHLMSMGRYIDHFQRRNGEWRIANRVMVSEGNFELYDNEAVNKLPLTEGMCPLTFGTRDRTDPSYQRPLRPRPIPKRPAHRT